MFKGPQRLLDISMREGHGVGIGVGVGVGVGVGLITGVVNPLFGHKNLLSDLHKNNGRIT